jgi:hypothetical protein
MLYGSYEAWLEDHDAALQYDDSVSERYYAELQDLVNEGCMDQAQAEYEFLTLPTPVRFVRSFGLGLSEAFVSVAYALQAGVATSSEIPF